MVNNVMLIIETKIILPEEMIVWRYFFDLMHFLLLLIGPMIRLEGDSSIGIDSLALLLMKFSIRITVNCAFILMLYIN